MRWDAGEIVRFARGAGFTRDDAVTATAIALATSGGMDHFTFCPGGPGAGCYVGLWGIDTDRWPDYAADTLHDPTVNARAAIALTRACDGFGWAPAYVSGVHLHHVARAGTESTRELANQQPARAVGASTTSRVVDESLARVRAVRTLLANVHTYRR